ncbi:hypothetical protein FS749_001963 [Ceratobasidium sp. UAMH 11750]|nr:hypothetical protein FS749_001963 [Ceratobasidium sp. UAMH 11750]
MTNRTAQSAGSTLLPVRQRSRFDHRDDHDCERTDIDPEYTLKRRCHGCRVDPERRTNTPGIILVGNTGSRCSRALGNVVDFPSNIISGQFISMSRPRTEPLSLDAFSPFSPKTNGSYTILEISTQWLAGDDSNSVITTMTEVASITSTTLRHKSFSHT